jgi:hypothetical protein
MNEQIEKAIKYAEKHRMSWTQLAPLLMQPPYNLTAADATKVLDEYRRRFPKMKNHWDTEKARAASFKTKTTVVEEDGITVTTTQAVKVVASDPPPFAKSEVAALAESNYQPSILNRSAVKDFALAVSKEKRGGKFTRVSPDFIKSVEADLEAVLRAIGGPEPEEDVAGERSFINSRRACAKAEEQLNRAVRKIILRRVKSQPSLGQTLK